MHSSSLKAHSPTNTSTTSSSSLINRKSKGHSQEASFSLFSAQEHPITPTGANSSPLFVVKPDRDASITYVSTDLGAAPSLEGVMNVSDLKKLIGRSFLTGRDFVALHKVNKRQREWFNALLQTEPGFDWLCEFFKKGPAYHESPDLKEVLSLFFNRLMASVPKAVQVKNTLWPGQEQKSFELIFSGADKIFREKQNIVSRQNYLKALLNMYDEAVTLKFNPESLMESISINENEINVESAQKIINYLNYFLYFILIVSLFFSIRIYDDSPKLSIALGTLNSLMLLGCVLSYIKRSNLVSPLHDAQYLKEDIITFKHTKNNLFKKNNLKQKIPVQLTQLSQFCLQLLKEDKNCAKIIHNVYQIIRNDLLDSEQGVDKVKLLNAGLKVLLTSNWFKIMEADDILHPIES